MEKYLASFFPYRPSASKKDKNNPNLSTTVRKKKKNKNKQTNKQTNKQKKTKLKSHLAT